MLSYMSAEKIGWKRLVQKFIRRIQSDSEFFKLSIFVFYSVMILFRTLFNRGFWTNPTSNVIGVWGFYNEKGEFTTEIIENTLLFIPFTALLLSLIRKNYNKIKYNQNSKTKNFKIQRIIYYSVIYSFCVSLAIETLQLVFRLGTFQLSDLFFNTLGGLIGGICYRIICFFDIPNKNEQRRKK